MVNRSSNMLLSPFPSFKHIVLVLLLALGIAVPFASAQNKNAPQMSDRAAEDIGKLQPYIDAKNWGGAINLLNGMLRYAAPNSYDEALINDIVSKIYLQKGDYALSLSPLGKAYELGEGYAYFDPRSQLDRLYYLAQLFYQEATTTKDIKVQQDYFSKATNYIEIWLQRSPTAKQDGRMFYVSLLYNRAILDPKKVDNALLKKTQEQLYEALNVELYPKEGFYVILLATLQQAGDSVRTSEVL